MASIHLRRAAASAFALALAATPVLAQGIADWDGDADGLLNEEEFGTGFGEEGVFDDRDADDNMLLDQEELAWDGEAEAPWSDWDADGDELLDEEEFNAGAFDRYDADDDGLIGEAEFGDLGDDLGEEGLFDF